MKIVLSFVAAFLLVLLPLPGWATMYRPDWVVLVLIYWCLVEPERVGPVAGWVVGLAVDITQANLLGLNALGMSLIAYLVNRFHHRLLIFPWLQQSVAILLLLVLYRGLVGWIRGFFSTASLDIAYWVPCLVGMLVWPALFFVLSELSWARRARRVH